MILALTDGVGLTDRLGSNRSTRRLRDSSAEERRNLLNTFFRIQIQQFLSSAKQHRCMSYWRVVKTTGDGLLLLADDDECTHLCEKRRDIYSDFIEIFGRIEEECHKHKIQLRSVIHHCSAEDIIHGHELNLDGLGISDTDLAALRADIFGLEVIRLARVASTAKGPFHLATKAFIDKITGLSRNPDAIKDELRDISSDNTVYQIYPEPLRLVYLKGFTADGYDHTINFDNPYDLWEINYITAARS